MGPLRVVFAMLQLHPLVHLGFALMPLILMILVAATLSAASVRPVCQRFTGMTMVALALGLLSCAVLLGTNTPV